MSASITSSKRKATEGIDDAALKRYKYDINGINGAGIVTKILDHDPDTPSDQSEAIISVHGKRRLAEPSPYRVERCRQRTAAEQAANHDKLIIRGQKATRARFDRNDSELDRTLQKLRYCETLNEGIIRVNAELREKLGVAEVNEKTAKSKAEGCEKKIEALDAQKREDDDEIARLKSEVAALKKQKEDAEAEAKKQRRFKKKKIEDVNILTANMAAYKNTMETQMGELKAANEELKVKVQHNPMKGNEDALKAENAELVLTNENLERQVGVLKTENEDLHGEVKRLSEKAIQDAATVQTAHTSLQNRIDEMTAAGKNPKKPDSDEAGTGTTGPATDISREEIDEDGRHNSEDEQRDLDFDEGNDPTATADQTASDVDPEESGESDSGSAGDDLSSSVQDDPTTDGDESPEDVEDDGEDDNLLEAEDGAFASHNSDDPTASTVNGPTTIKIEETDNFGRNSFRDSGYGSGAEESGFSLLGAAGQDGRSIQAPMSLNWSSSSTRDLKPLFGGGSVQPGGFGADGSIELPPLDDEAGVCDPSNVDGDDGTASSASTQVQFVTGESHDPRWEATGKSWAKSDMEPYDGEMAADMEVDPPAPEDDTPITAQVLDYIITDKTMKKVPGTFGKVPTHGSNLPVSSVMDIDEVSAADSLTGQPTSQEMDIDDEGGFPRRPAAPPTGPRGMRTNARTRGRGGVRPQRGPQRRNSAPNGITKHAPSAGAAANRLRWPDTGNRRGHHLSRGGVPASRQNGDQHLRNTGGLPPRNSNSGRGNGRDSRGSREQRGGRGGRNPTEGNRGGATPQEDAIGLLREAEAKRREQADAAKMRGVRSGRR